VSSTAFGLLLSLGAADIDERLVVVPRECGRDRLWAAYRSPSRAHHRRRLRPTRGRTALRRVRRPSRTRLIEMPGGFDYTGADCQRWMRQIGSRDTYVKPLVGPDSMVVGIK